MDITTCNTLCSLALIHSMAFSLFSFGLRWHLGPYESFPDVFLPPVADQGRLGEDLLKVGVLHHGLSVLAEYGAEPRQARVVSHHKHRPVRHSALLNLF